MNQIISAINKQKITILANEGRLLKKLIFASIIFVLASQSGILGATVQKAIVDAYLQVSVFVGLTLLIFIGFDSLSNFNLDSFLLKSKKFHIAIAAFLGAIPGCGGAVIVVTQYIQGRISFGSLVAVLTATMGDAAFLLLAIEPSTGLLIFSIGLTVGIVSGYVIDFYYKDNLINDSNKALEKYEKINKTFVSNFNILWLTIFAPGFILGIFVAFQVNIDSIVTLPLDLKITSLIGISGGIMCKIELVKIIALLLFIKGKPIFF